MFRADKDGKSTPARWRLVGGWLLAGGALLFTCAYRQSLLYDRPGFHESPLAETFAPWTTPLPDSLYKALSENYNSLSHRDETFKREVGGRQLSVSVSYAQNEPYLAFVYGGRYLYDDPIQRLSDYDVKYALLGGEKDYRAGCLDKMLLIDERNLLFELLQIIRRGSYLSNYESASRPSKDGKTGFRRSIVTASGALVKVLWFWPCMTAECGSC